MKDLELDLFNSDKLVADEKYISEGKYVVSKEFLKSKILKQYTNMENVMAEMMSTIPYERGEDWELPTTVRLREYKSFAFDFDDENAFDYKVIELFEDAFYRFNISYSVVYKKFNGGVYPVLKVFTDKGEFIGLIAPMWRGK